MQIVHSSVSSFLVFVMVCCGSQGWGEGGGETGGPTFLPLWLIILYLSQ